MFSGISSLPSNATRIQSTEKYFRWQKNKNVKSQRQKSKIQFLLSVHSACLSFVPVPSLTFQSSPTLEQVADTGKVKCILKCYRLNTPFKRETKCSEHLNINTLSNYLIIFRWNIEKLNCSLLRWKDNPNLRCV